MKLTAESFLSVVKRSELIEPERLKRLLAECREKGVDVDDTQSLARELVKRGILTTWQADKLLQGKSRGFFLGKYRLLSLLGKGGMSSVYLAEHVLMRRRCAVKVLPQKRVNDSSYLGRFHREAQAVASLDHPNIVRAYDVDVDKSIEKNHEIHFLVMEYVEGRSLQELVQGEGVLDPVRTADFVRQAADGLQHAHDAGMVHRDIKPGNLLVDNNGVVRILDLGLARFFEDQDEESLTVAHDEKVLGTADYLAPEQALDSHKVDARADIYSLGCTAYFLLTGHPPFTQGTLAQRLMAHQTKEPPAIETERSNVPGGLLAIIRKMMAKNPDERQQTAAGVAEEMAAWLQAEGGDDWRMRHPNLAGSGPGINGPSSAAASDTDTIAGSPTVTPPPDAADDNLAAFLTKLESDPSIDAVSPSGIIQKRAGRKSGVNLGDKTEKPRADSGKSSAAEPLPKPVPVAKPISPPPKTTAENVPPISVGRTIDSKVASTPPPAIATTQTEKPASLLQDKRVRIAAMAVAGVVLIGGIVWGIAAMVGGPKDDPDNSNQTGNGKSGKTEGGGNGKTSDGEIVVDPAGKVTTITAAIEQARKQYEAGNRKEMSFVIRVRGGKTYKDRILLDNGDSSLDNLTLRILCTDSDPAVLAPTGPESVIRLTNMKNFMLEGCNVKSDKAKTAVELNGSCYGLKLTRLSITGFTETGIVASHLQGFISSEVVLQKLRIDSEGSNAVGLRFTGESSRVKISGCRFLGPMSAGILYQNDALESSISHCVFHAMNDGIQFRGRLRLQRYSITRNTFYGSTNGIVFSAIPTDNTAELVISKNLFAKMKTSNAVIRGRFKPEDFRKMMPSDGSGLKENMTDRAGAFKTDIPFLFGLGGTKTVLKFKATKPDDENFLLPAGDAAHKDVGAGKDND